MDPVTRLIADLVAIDSINPDLVPGGAGEAAMARFIAEWFGARGISAHLEEVRPGRPNVIAVVPGTGGGRRLILNGHLDTVGVAGMTAPHRAELTGDRLFGRGASDMKCGLAAAMMATAWAKTRSLRGDVIFTGVMDEEFAGLGTLDVAKRHRADAAIVAESTNLELVVAHKGFVWFEIETKGVAAHGSRPDLGVDAIAQMGKVLVELEALNRRLLAAPSHPLLKSGSLHASLIQGGQELSSYPERCLLSVERRTVPGERPEDVVGQIDDILARLAAADPTFSATVRSTLLRSPMENSSDSPIAAAILRASASTLGHAAPVTGMGGWTDAASLSEAGIPAVLFGPIGKGAHAVEEWVDLTSVRQCVAIFQAVIEDFCGSG